MTSMEPFSPPFAIDKKAKRYGCYIDVDGRPHEASWAGDWAVFDFTDTSHISNFELVPLRLTAEMSTVWKCSKPLAFGSHASVRFEETVPYPVIKIAHPTDKCRRLVEREFNIMRGLPNLDAVARVGGEPLADQDGIFGFRLEHLYRVELEDLQQRSQEVRKLLETLHGAGYCHGDYSFSNIMQNQEGRLVLIDLAFAGPLGSEIPESFPKHLLPGGRYNANIDQERMERWGKFRC